MNTEGWGMGALTATEKMLINSALEAYAKPEKESCGETQYKM